MSELKLKHVDNSADEVQLISKAVYDQNKQILKNIVKETVELERMHISETVERDELNEDDDYQKYSDEAGRIFDEIKSKVDKDTLKLISKLVDAKNYTTICYGDYFFRKGVQAGLTSLKYLEKAKTEIMML